MDSRQTQKQKDDNRANQCNMEHQPSGPGREREYGGTGDKPDLDNHAQQKDPNSGRYTAPKK